MPAMISDELGHQLHERATRGQRLTAEEQAQLASWYAEKDHVGAEQPGLSVAEAQAAYSVSARHPPSRPLRVPEAVNTVLPLADTVQISLELPRSIFAALRQDPPNFISQMRLAAAAKWYEIGLLSQARAAEVAGVSRSEFLTSLARFGVSPFQYDADEIVKEVSGA
jgi:predicted HTH domain antitoxin